VRLIYFKNFAVFVEQLRFKIFDVFGFFHSAPQVGEIFRCAIGRAFRQNIGERGLYFSSHGEAEKILRRRIRVKKINSPVSIIKTASGKSRKNADKRIVVRR